MDRRERAPNPEETLRLVIESYLRRTWVCLPCVVQSFDPTTMRITAQPAINGVVRNRDGSTSDLQMPVLLDCPVVFPGGGGATLTFPVKPGDECLVIFADRCIDNWWAQSWVPPAAPGGSNGANTPSDRRMHNLSDGFAFVGIRSKPRLITVDPNVVRLRSDDDSTYVEFNPTAKTLKMVASGDITLNGLTIDSSGNITNAGNISSTGTVNAQIAVEVNGVPLTVP